MPVITFTDSEPWEKSQLAAALPGHALNFFQEPLEKISADQLQAVEILSVFIYSQVNAAALARLPNLRFVATRSTGFDHLDLAALGARGIPSANVPSYGENTVAEHAVALLLALTRKIIPSAERTRRGDFTLDGLRGTDLCGKTLGVVGVGHIGQQVVKIGKGLGMTVVAYDSVPKPSLASQLDFEYLDLNQLLRRSDAVTLHAPFTSKTRHLINVKNIQLLKRGSFLINTARGGLIETEALIQGLKQGILAGVGLDVLEEECVIREERQLLSEAFKEECDLKTVLAEHALLNQENVIITPHNAFNSQEALGRILETTAKNIRAFLSGQPENLIKS